MLSAGDNALRARIENLLGPAVETAGILDRHGRVLMSSWDSVRRSPFMVLGINPGGAACDPVPPGESVADSLRETKQGWSYFSDATAKPLHRSRVGAVLSELEVPVLGTPFTNVHFLRSRREQELPRDHATVWERHCAPVHAELLRAICPKVIVCFGITAWKLLTGKGDPGHWRFHPKVVVRVARTEHQCGVLLYPHFASRSWPGIDREPHRQAIADARACAAVG